jgi:MFS family permease
VACAFSLLGGAGNGVQLVTLISAVQELTAAEYQARVASLLESLSAAMPGVGFLLGGAIAALLSPRASYLVAGLGVLLVVALGAVFLTRRERGASAVGIRQDEPYLVGR